MTSSRGDARDDASTPPRHLPRDDATTPSSSPLAPMATPSRHHARGAASRQATVLCGGEADAAERYLAPTLLDADGGGSHGRRRHSHAPCIFI
jgi:hypothetical protein